jgi:hypothetical protein
MRIRIECGLDSRSRAGVWPNDRAGVRAVRTIQGGKNEVRIRFGCRLDSRSRAGVWPNDRAGVRTIQTIQGGKNEVRIRFENIRYMHASSPIHAACPVHLVLVLIILIIFGEENKLIAVLSHNNYYSQFYGPFCKLVQ